MNRAAVVLMLAGLGAGFAIGKLSSGDATPEPADEPEVAALHERIAELEAEARPARAKPALKRAPARPQKPREAIPDVEGRIGKAEAAIRARAEDNIKNARQLAKWQIDREIAAEKAARARELAARKDLERGGPMAFLGKLDKDWVARWELLQSPDEYGAMFERKAKGARIDSRSLTADTELQDGDTILFGPGIHFVNAQAIFNGKTIPKDLLLEGYGMDKSLIVLSTELRPQGLVYSLTLRDLTIHCNDNYLEQMRGSYTLRVERCRVIGFDMGAGGSNMLSGDTGAFYATDSRIEAGFGRSPNSGNLFDVRGTLLVRLENCVISGPFSSVYYQWSGAAHVFDNCRFINMSERFKQRVERKPRQVRFIDCSFEYLTKDQLSTSRKQRGVSEINPAWTKKALRAAEKAQRRR